jgi:hypothetical protein
MEKTFILTNISRERRGRGRGKGRGRGRGRSRASRLGQGRGLGHGQGRGQGRGKGRGLIVRYHYLYVTGRLLARCHYLYNTGGLLAQIGYMILGSITATPLQRPHLCNGRGRLLHSTAIIPCSEATTISPSYYKVTTKCSIAITPPLKFRASPPS